MEAGDVKVHSEWVSQEDAGAGSTARSGRAEGIESPTRAECCAIRSPTSVGPEEAQGTVRF